VNGFMAQIAEWESRFLDRRSLLIEAFRGYEVTGLPKRKPMSDVDSLRRREFQRVRLLSRPQYLRKPIATEKIAFENANATPELKVFAKANKGKIPKEMDRTDRGARASLGGALMSRRPRRRR
jgi:hypothetical protein